MEQTINMIDVAIKINHSLKNNEYLTDWLSSCERYNFRDENWTKIASMNDKRANTGVVCGEWC